MMSATFFASLLYLPQFMIKILGFSPIEAGLGLLPMMGLFARRPPSSRDRCTTASAPS